MASEGIFMIFSCCRTPRIGLSTERDRQDLLVRGPIVVFLAGWEVRFASGRPYPS